MNQYLLDVGLGVGQKLQELALALDLDLLAGVVRVGGVEVQVATVRRLGNMGE